MTFATSFLPTPAHWNAFKSFLELKYVGKDSAIVVQHLDYLDFVRHEMNLSGFTQEDEEIWQHNAMGFPGWGMAYGSVGGLHFAVEAWMDAQEHRAKQFD